MEFSVQQAAKISGRYEGQQNLARRVQASEARLKTTAPDRVDISEAARRLLAEASPEAQDPSAA